MLSNIIDYEPPNLKYWQGRADSLPGERFFQTVKSLDITKESLCTGNDLVIIGFGCDAGIKRNLGQPGAKEAPNTIRGYLSRLANHSSINLIDVGNVVCHHDDLESVQEQFAQIIHYCHQHQHPTIALGGGHEIAWPHFKGLSTHYPKIGILNIDAHFDLRPLINHQGSSGTPFSQIHAYCQTQELAFNYCCLGIQPAANTASLFNRANEFGVSYLTASQMIEESYAWQTAFLDNFLFDNDYIYLTICMDVFAECFAPGVSAPQPMGINPWHVLPLLKYVRQTGKVISIDIAEVSPLLDKRGKTSRLAAMILAELLNLTYEGL